MGSDRIRALGGADKVAGDQGDDSLIGGKDNDTYLNLEVPFGDDVIEDSSGRADVLDLSNFDFSEVESWQALDDRDARANIDHLRLDFASGDSITIRRYFDNKTTDGDTSGPGRGLIEAIRFSERHFGFDEVKDRIADGGSSPPSASDDSASTDEDAPVVIDVLDNDTPAETGQTLNVEAGSLGVPANGSVQLITEDGPDKGKVRYTPDADYNNTAQIPDTFTYQACDDGEPPECDEATVGVAVAPVNDKPSFIEGADQTIDEDPDPRAQTIAGWATGFDPGPDDESGQQVADYIVTDENGEPPASNLFTQDGQPDVTNGGDLTYTPTENANGSANFLVAVRDDGGTDRGGMDTSDARSFTITVNAINDEPTISNVQDQTISEGGNTGALSFTVGDDETAADNLTVTGSSDYTSLVPDANIGIGGTGAGRTVTVTPATEEFGSATITLTVTDGDDATTTETFEFTVRPVNDKPSFTSQGNQTVNEDPDPRSQTVTGWVTGFDPGPDNESGQAVADYIATVPAAQQTLFTGTGQPDVSNDGTLTYTPAQDASGQATVEAAVRDDGGTDNGGIDTSDAQAFTITITPENDQPTISNVADQTINEDQNTGDLAFTVGDAETPDNLTVTSRVVDSSNPNLLGQGSVTLGGSGANRTVRVTPVANQSGTATIEIKVGDPDGGSATETFLLTVNPTNDPPDAVNDTASTNEGEAVVIDVLDNDSSGPNESQTLSVEADTLGDPSNGSTELITTGDDAGKVRYTPDAGYSNANTPDTFTYEACDDGTPVECDQAAVSVTVNPEAGTGINVTGTSADETLTGTPHDDYLDGAGGNDTINALPRNDTIIGGTGNDSLDGGDGDDLYVFAPNFAIDTFMDSAGTDTLEFITFNTAVIARLNEGHVSANATQSHVSGVTGAENVVGGTNIDTITGNDADNFLDGRAGADTISGGNGDDTLDGGATIILPTGSIRSSGNDTLNGGTGDDTLKGDADDDILKGDADNDTYMGYTGTFGADTADDTAGVADVLDLSNFNLSDVTSWQATDGSDSGTNVDRLVITFASGNSVTVLNYFDNTSADDDASGSGVGQIENIVFGDDSSVDFGQVKGLIP